MSDGGTDCCKWVPEKNVWNWKRADADPITPNVDGRVLFLHDGVFRGLNNSGRFGELLKSIEIVGVEVDGIRGALSLLESQELLNWCSGSVHTIILSIGASDIIDFEPEQIRDGILQVAETISSCCFERVNNTTDDDDLLPQILIFELPPRSKDHTSDTADAKLQEVNNLLKKIDYAPYPHLQSLLLTKMLRINHNLHDEFKQEETIHSGPVSLSTRSYGVLVQAILDYILKMWPGSNPPAAVLEWMKQLGLKGYELVTSHYTSSSSFDRAKSSISQPSKADLAPSNKSWASIVATQRSSASNKLNSMGNFSKLRGMNTVRP